jgi:3'(2'), 5'-bisphosphate nucleotidase
MAGKTETLLLAALEAARAGGREILEVYATDFDVEVKGDKSPLTEADKRSQAVIHKLLAQAEPGLHFLGEEGKAIPYDERKGWKRFWLVDPLDGTKEFVSRNGEFTVNIALIEDGRPVMGIVYAPVLDLAYLGVTATGTALKLSVKTLPDRPAWSEVESAATRLPCAHSNKFTVAGSRSHMNPETEAYIEECRKLFGEVEVRNSGSSLNICQVAEGLADIYPRIAPTSEWDVASGHAVIEAAGGACRRAGTREPLVYNKANLLNPSFVVVSRPYLDRAPLG